MGQVSVVDVPERSRYEVEQDGEVIGFAAYSRQGDSVVLPHVEVEPAHQHQGLAGRLVQQAMDDARAQGLRVLPICPFAVRWIGEHPEYQDLDARRAS
ncbi:N-acetyltransferase [Nocardioides mangrovicus]|uniref:N-acetyltransferase n=1 Tax=Nocardioides mangrovicus TaxID=2478913 RepID=A0A3L8P225_9ACTN|nr:GNAT family N-acetyltransferase [Nocardioides mangrovicus]RLV49101.1 N-acetyltransferase [Nocardioides mangrovicus]